MRRTPTAGKQNYFLLLTQRKYGTLLWETKRTARIEAKTDVPVLLRLEQEGAIASERGASENNRRARYYRLTSEGRRQLHSEVQDWHPTAEIIARFLSAKAGDLS